MKAINVLLVIGACLYCTGGFRIRRQSDQGDWSWGSVQRPQSGNRPQPPPLIRPTLQPVQPVGNNALPEGSVPMPPPPNVAACLATCRTTPEYNPVCGSDGSTYHNRERLNCQRLCTQTDIEFVRLGTCAPL